MSLITDNRTGTHLSREKVDLRSGVISKRIRLISGDKSQQLVARLTAAEEEQLFNRNELGVNFHLHVFLHSTTLGPLLKC